MIDQLKELADRAKRKSAGANGNASLAPLRAVTAQLLLATGASTTLEQVAGADSGENESALRVPPPLTWAPLLLGPLAAAANLEHARRPTERTAVALRFLAAATVGLGGSLFILDTFVHRDRPPTRLAPLAFASAGLLGLMIDRQESEVARAEERLRRRARVVERLVPPRKAKLDRVVVHV